MPELSQSKIFTNCTVLTMEDESVRDVSIGVKGDRIVAIGPLSEVRKATGDDAQLVDLAGGTVIPGMIDPHTHARTWVRDIFESTSLRPPPIGDIKTIDALLARLKETAERTPSGEWVLGSRYDHLHLEERRHPTRSELDAITTEHPIYVTHATGHAGVLNTLALELFGVIEAHRKGLDDGYEVDPETGELTGVIRRASALRAVHRIPYPELDRQVKGLAAMQDDFLQVGITTAHDAWVQPPDSAMFVELANQGDLRLRMQLMPDYGRRPGGEEPWADVDGAAGDLSLGAVKLFADGSLPGRTAWLTKPYTVPNPGRGDACGHSVVGPEELKRAVTELHAQGHQVAIHGDGDAGIDSAIAAIRAAQEANPRSDARHRIEHVQYPRLDQLDEMLELGITPSFFVGGVYYWGDQYSADLGPERAAGVYPLRSALDRGLTFSLHSDSAHVPADPLFSVFVAVNRVTSAGMVLGADEQISTYEALKAVTINAAWQGFEEADKGTITPGKLADLVVLSGNPLKASPSELVDIVVDRVIIGGAEEFTRTASTPPSRFAHRPQSSLVQ